jgi:nitroreductase
MDLQTAITWRYATKRMTGKRLTETDLDQILEAIRLAPTSRGIQPFKIFVIESDEVKAAIRPIADNQAQIVECSHLLVFAAEKSTTRDSLENYILNLATERNVPTEKLDGLKNVLFRDQLVMNEEQYYHWSSKQAYIALAYGQLMASTLGIDAAALEGFNAKELDNLLKLKDFELRSTVLLALGYRDEDTDYMLKLKKVRKSRTELFPQIESLK